MDQRLRMLCLIRRDSRRTERGRPRDSRTPGKTSMVTIPLLSIDMCLITESIPSSRRCKRMRVGIPPGSPGCGGVVDGPPLSAGCRIWLVLDRCARRSSSNRTQADRQLAPLIPEAHRSHQSMASARPSPSRTGRRAVTNFKLGVDGLRIAHARRVDRSVRCCRRHRGLGADYFRTRTGCSGVSISGEDASCAGSAAFRQHPLGCAPA